MQKKYSTYNALSLCLRRAKIENHAKLATFFLDSFLENQSRIRASEVYKRGLCSENEKEFRDWRKDLCSKGWLEFIIENNKNVTYRPGKKLLKYINREKQNRFEIATTDDVRAATKGLATKDDLATKASIFEMTALKNEIEKVKKALSLVINEYDPPVTKEKLQARLAKAEKEIFN